MEAFWEREFPREELADYLASLAEQIRRGEIQVAGLRQPLPAHARATISLREKKGRLQAKLHLHFDTLASYVPQQQAALAKELEGFQAVKKRLAASWKALRQAAAGGALPDEHLLAAFVQDCQAFAGQAEPDWEAEMAAFLSHVHNLEEAHRRQQIEMFHHELADIQASLTRCHKELK